jgi:hypothetical protein
MEAQNWKNCPLIEVDPERVHGAPVFKGSRLPVDTVVENVDAFMEIEGQSLDEAVASTLECFPDTPGGAAAIRTVIAHRDAHELQMQP